MRFFLYGTLMAGSANPVARRLHGLLGPGEAATAHGRLYAIEDAQGWYPGLFADPCGELVHGSLHEATRRFAPEDLAALDRYENFNPPEPVCTEFVRQETPVDTVNRRLAATAYLLREAPIKDIVIIPGGSFTGFIEQHGLRAWGSETN